MEIVALVVLGLMAAWLLGGFVLRVGGLFLIFLTLFALVSGAADSLPAGAAYAALWFVVGVLMWLVGHWHFAWRRGWPNSALAEQVFSRVPRAFDPLRRFRPASAGPVDVGEPAVVRMYLAPAANDHVGDRDADVEDGAQVPAGGDDRGSAPTPRAVARQRRGPH